MQFELYIFKKRSALCPLHTTMPTLSRSRISPCEVTKAAAKAGGSKVDEVKQPGKFFLIRSPRYTRVLAFEVLVAQKMLQCSAARVHVVCVH